MPLLMLMLALLSAWPVQAQSAQGLRYRAPASCPNQAELVAQVQARTAKATFDRSFAAQPFEVEVEPAGQGFSGRVTRAGHAPRSVAGDSCDDVVSALALIVALAIDPTANLSTQAPGAEAPSSPPRLAPWSGVTANRADVPSAPPGASPRPRAILGLWLRAHATHGLSDGALTWWGGSGGGEIVVPVRTWLRPSARLGLLGAGSRGALDARFRLLSSHLELSALRVGGRSWSIEPTFALQIGQLLVHDQADRPAPKLWLALTEGLLFQLFVTSRLSLGLLTSLCEPLRRYAFVLTSPPSQRRVANVRGVELSLALGLGLHF